MESIKHFQVVRGNHEQFMIEDGQKLINKLLADSKFLLMV
jgi:hypothetical protein